jgi:hypothetical protein
VLYPRSALVAASVRHGQRAQTHRDDLLQKASAIASQEGFVDVPILGCVLFALAVWELVFGSHAHGERLLAYARKFAFSRMVPCFNWEWATSLGEPADLGARKAPELRPELSAFLTQLL